MQTVSINGASYNSYASLDEAKTYLAGSVATEEWDTVDDNGKAKFLVASTRVVQRQVWSTEPPELVLKEATIELARILADDPDVFASPSSIKSIKAGSVMVENFRSYADFASPFPSTVFALLRPYLANISVVGGAASFDTKNWSDFEEDDYPGYNRGI